MGTSEKTLSLVWLELKEGLKKAGLSVPEFARWVYHEINEIVDSEDENSFVEAFKKQVQRESSTPGMLKRAENYLQLLHQNEVYINRTGRVPPRSIDYPEIDEKTRADMRRISRMIDERLRFNDNEDVE